MKSPTHRAKPDYSIAVFFSLEKEAQGMIKAAGLKKSDSLVGLKVYEGIYEGLKLFVILTGVGERRAEKSARKFLNAIRPSFVISSGWAGALNENFRVGDLLIPTRITRCADGVSLVLDDRIIELIKPCLKELPIHYPHSGLTVDRVFDKEQKVSIKKKYPYAGMVDMESCAVLNVLNSQGIPILILRSVSDSYHAKLPKIVTQFSYYRGKKKWLQLAALILNPLEAMRILRITFNCWKAERNHTQALLRLIKEFPLTDMDKRSARFQTGSQFSAGETPEKY